MTDSRPLSLIVAAGADGAIGRDGDLIWHLREDLRRFKRLTTGHCIIMGRKTWESLPGGALPGRRNIVVTRNAAYSAPGAETAASLEEAIALAADDPEPFIIGGAQIYAAALPLCNRIYLTRVDASCPGADARFPSLNPEEWAVAGIDAPATAADGTAYRFITLLRC